MKATTREWLVSKKACKSGLDWYDQQGTTDTATILRALVRDDKFDDARWLLSRVMDKRESVTWAVWCAKEVLAVYEAKHTDDRPRKAIEAAQARLDNPCVATERDAADAAYAAYAADAASAAAYAAAYAAAAAHAADAADAGEAFRLAAIEKIIEIMEEAK